MTDQEIRKKVAEIVLAGCFGMIGTFTVLMVCGCDYLTAGILANLSAPIAMLVALVKN